MELVCFLSNHLQQNMVELRTIARIERWIVEEAEEIGGCLNVPAKRDVEHVLESRRNQQ